MNIQLNNEKFTMNAEQILLNVEVTMPDKRLSELAYEYSQKKGKE